MNKKEGLFGYIFISPWIIGLLVFTIGPIVFSFALIFSSWNLIGPLKFVGLENIWNILHSTFFWSALRNTAFFTLYVPISVILSLIVAVLMNRIPGSSIFRLIYFLPSVTPAVANAAVWIWLLQPSYGVVDNALKNWFNIEGPGWFSDPNLYIPTLMMISIWGSIGYNSILFTAGLKSIDKSIYEAAYLDGSNSISTFFRITVPLISPTIFFVTVTSVIWSFQVFDLAYMTNNGVTSYYNITLVQYIYQLGFQYFHIGEASALAWILTGIIFLITLFELQAEKKLVFYQ
ncbi:carbohydrate ABC transporter permease [Athalassotoga saccharophila]|uniref:carbohydrate ABC transporter permease n=1 Tax=Athalassotoga saccharophila TaxID=1441386 RepID=UPI001379F149|nr:sugar ABC transporter permease [Athalassotoga saccharophila]BBJ28194.1 lactose transport system permease protein LacF [Athalassotoga saccharophila]